MKFTFKTIKPTGKWKSFDNDNHIIKLNKKEVGYIIDDDKKPFEIRLAVIKKDILEDGNANCVWKWITLKKESETLQEAKDFLNENINAILEKIEIYYFD